MKRSRKDDPYYDEKIYHFANLFSELGASALCYKAPKAINLKIALWTITENAVTCPKCLKKLRERTATKEDAK